MVQRLDEAFEIYDQALTEELLRAAPVLEKINKFFMGDGPSRLIFYLVGGNDDGADRPSTPALIVSDGTNMPLARRAVFFMKTVKPPAEDEDSPVSCSQVCYHIHAPSRLNDFLFCFFAVHIPLVSTWPRKPPIDPTTSLDGALTFGVIESPLASMESVVGSLYKPLLEMQPEKEWGLAGGNERGEFLTAIEALVANLQESIKSLGSGLALLKPDGGIVAARASSADAASDPSLVSYFVGLLEDWCAKVQAFLEDSDRRDAPESGPDTELEYWR